MSTVNILPSELFKIIFKYVNSRTDLYHCALVCKTWNKQANTVLYEKIIVKQFPILLNCFFYHKRRVGEHCIYLQFNHMENAGATEDYEELLLQVPNVEKVKLRFSTYNSYHLNHIADNHHLLKYLTEIEMAEVASWTRDNMQAYYECVSAFKNQIRRMKFASLNKIISAADGRSGNITTFLSDFTHLTMLDIKNGSRKDSFTLDLNMFSILRSCPNLERFSLRNDFLESEIDDEVVLFNHSKLKYLDISLPQLTDRQIGYMARNITQLRTVKINIGSSSNVEDDLVFWTSTVSPYHLNLLKTFLSGVDDIHIRIGRKLQVTVDEYWNFFGSIIENSLLTPVHVSLLINNEVYGEIEMKKNRQIIYLHCSIVIRNFSTIRNILNNGTIITPSQLENSNVCSYRIMFEPGYKRNEIYKHHIGITETVLSTFDLNDFSLTVPDTRKIPGFHIRFASNEINEFGLNDIKNMSFPRSPNLQTARLSYVLLANVEDHKYIRKTLDLNRNTQHLIIIGCKFPLNKNFNATLDLRNCDLKDLAIGINSILEKVDSRNIFALQVQRRGQGLSIYKCDNLKTLKVEEVNDKSYLRKFGRLKSPRCNILVVQCNSVDNISIHRC